MIEKEILGAIAVALFIGWFVLHEQRTNRNYARSESHEALERAAAATASNATSDPLPSIADNESLVASVNPPATTDVQTPTQEEVR